MGTLIPGKTAIPAVAILIELDDASTPKRVDHRNWSQAVAILIELDDASTHNYLIGVVADKLDVAILIELDDASTPQREDTEHEAWLGRNPY